MGICIPLAVRRRAGLVAVALGVLALGGRASAQTTILTDNFESYADTAALEAVWGAAGTTTASLDTANGNPGQSIFHPGLTSYQRTFTPTGSSATNALVWEFDFLDDGIGNKRITGALRDVGASGAGNRSFLEMGRFNSIDNPEDTSTTANVSGYGIRTAFIGAPANDASGWMTFVGNPTARTGWHHFRATITGDTILFELDFADDGTVDASRTVSVPTNVDRTYNIVRFGGPSDVSSAGGGANFDNLSITVVPVPEPAALAVLGLCAPALLARRRR